MLRAICLLVAVSAAPAIAGAPPPPDGDDDPPVWWTAYEPPEDLSGGPRYLVEGVQVRGNRTTETGLIVREVGISPGDVITPEDPRVKAAELRLLSLGFFLTSRLRLDKGQNRGSVILVVEVEERGTAVLNAIHLGTSETTALWGGLDVTETNFLGRGIAIGGGFVQSTRPTVPEAVPGRAISARVAGPPARLAGLALSGSVLYARGSELFQAFGFEDEVDPAKWVALQTRRLGGSLAVGADLSRTTRFVTEGRFESLSADLPSIRTRDLGGGHARPIRFGIHDGPSRLASLTATIDFDTRSDPVLPHAGRRMALSLEAALPVFGSRYTYAKGVAQGSFYQPAFRRHVVSFHLFGGGVFGDAPYFNQFFVGDLNFLLPPRALGLNFATLPSRDFLGTQVSGRRYEAFAARALVEYAVPLWRRRGFVYRGDAFAAFGIFGLASLDDLRLRDSEFGEAIPIDLTADLGVRLDTYVGIFTLSVANGLGRIPL
jgi:outer membrane protein insertion porin family